MTSTEKVVLWIVRFLMVCFAVVGCIFLIFPQGTLETVNALGTFLGSAPRIDPTPNDFWVSLTFAYMVSVTGIAYLIQSDLKRYRSLLILLAIAKAASSLSSLGFYSVHAPAFVFLLNFLVDGAISGTALACYALLKRSSDEGTVE